MRTETSLFPSVSPTPRAVSAPLHESAFPPRPAVTVPGQSVSVCTQVLESEGPRFEFQLHLFLV